jgi:hypothetical protein
MSTSWGYVCESHDPPLESERWLNHGESVLIDVFLKERAGEWPSFREDPSSAWSGEPFAVLPVGGQAEPVPPRPGGGTPPYSGIVPWLREHPHCKIALRSEYGDRRKIGRTVSGSVAPLAVER